MDRIDLQVIVSRLKPEEITSFSEGEDSASVRSRVQNARLIQQERYKNELNINSNAQMQSRHIRTWCKLDGACKNLIEAAIRKLGLSARASDRILKVSRTIADLEQADLLTPSHVAEAIQYRTLDRMT
jgi:magnesium chelatase family protein